MLDTIARERLTCAWFAPVMSGRLISHPGREAYDLTSLRWAIGGGERTPERLIGAFVSLFPNARYIDGYGLTESCSGDTLMEPGREIEKIGSTGRALPHVEIEIRDDAGAVLAANTPGEICLRGPRITKGYWKDPEKTARSFFGDWFRTGDIGYLDAEGFLFLTDRKKDMIISGGENIASSEVERLIFQLPQVSEVAVIGVPDPRWGEVPVAVVVLKQGAQLDLATLDRHCDASRQLQGTQTAGDPGVPAAQPVGQGAQTHAARDSVAINGRCHARTRAQGASPAFPQHRRWTHAKPRHHPVWGRHDGTPDSAGV